ncbi:hypothetical protein [Pseudonocardia acaciae]|uniref:hypothetical protein n=1 Tax=Pseudonocardia acaciae TaxID=551276 RepID=UPI00048E97A9|nr:hypothetical protein [Pseudonocardia acaciae]
MGEPGQGATPLSEALARGPVATGRLAGWGADLAHALAAAHATGRTHGNVRAEAVRITEDGTARLEGFDRPPPQRPEHPAPELVFGGKPSPATDVYALGAMLHQAGGGAEPALSELLTAMGDAEPSRRPDAAQVSDRLRRFAGSAAEPASPFEPTVTTSPFDLRALSGPASRPVPISPFEPTRPSASSAPSAPASPFGPPAPAPTKRRRRLAWIAVAAVVVLLGAAGGAVWLMRERPQATAVDLADPIGDVRTVSPCSLVDSAAMQRFGATRLYPDISLPSSCSVLMRPDTTDSAMLTVTVDEPHADDHDLARRPRQRAGAMTVYHLGEPDPGFCARQVLLPNRSRVLAVTRADTPTKMDMCAITDAGVQVVIAALNKGSLPRRAVAGPPNSVVWMDACGLLDDATLRRVVPGIDPTRRQRMDGGWMCKWGADGARADPATVSIILSSNVPTTEPTTVIGGRTAAVGDLSWENDRAMCAVKLLHRDYKGNFDERRVEQLWVYVHLTVATPDDAQCAIVNTLAQELAPKLPPPN